MIAILRNLLALILVVTLLGSTTLDVPTGLAAGIATEAGSCCEGECPEDPPCQASCALLLRCGAQTGAILPVADKRFVSRQVNVEQRLPEQSPPAGPPPDGLERPPRV